MADGGGSSVQLRAAMRALTRPDEAAVLDRLMAQARLDAEARGRITARAADLVRTVRKRSSPRLMEVFLAEYGLSTEEGVALMCLAEALLRVPDAATIDDLNALQAELARRVLDGAASPVTAEALISAWIDRRRQPVERIDQLIAELRALDHVDVSMLAVANRRLRGLMAG